ncbi:hypothetical protein MHBO_000526 [Bonamia ostreae]|uniref:Small ribosomal subunit protein uS10 domain-containing protein n=1 Tax=Bonamia ostreae TaxID=126728 RepID=A0ABV2AFV6_9EUKA
MSAAKPTKTTAMGSSKKADTEVQKLHNVRIKLTSNNKKNIEKTCSRLKENALRFDAKNIRGPKRFPIKNLKIVTRKSPCGEGTNTWDNFQMRIYKRILDFQATSDIVIKVTDFEMADGVNFDLTMKCI